MSHDEYAAEPIRGLPQRPPEGETLIWQGTPQWIPLAIRAFHVRKIAIYFSLIWVGFLAFDVYQQNYGSIWITTLWLFIPAALAIVILSAVAWLYARMTVYSITTHRLVIRSGIALPMSVNIPFAQIVSAACKSHRDGTADLPIRVARGQNASFLILWPNIRPWRFISPEPMLRCVPDGEHAAAVLVEALTAYAQPDSPVPRVAARLRESGNDELPKSATL